MAKPPRSGDRLDEGVVFGRYVLLHQLGVGAMGVVYAALDPDLNRKVALKLLRTDRLDRPDLGERLLREARAMAKVDHQHVATVHDFGRIGDRLYVAMEYIAGETLREWFASGPHPQARVFELLLQAGEGLAAAHRAGLVHRDFKPDNVMIDADGNARVLDFGLVRDDGPAETRIDGDGPKLTRVGARLGTPAYMAPEQHRGVQATHAADQFSFGVALFEGLYGHRPFAGKTRNAISIKILARAIEPVPPQRQIPAWQHAAIVRCLEPEPEDRWSTMDDLLQALRADPARKRRRVAEWTLGTATVAAMLGGVVWLGAGTDHRRSCETEVGDHGLRGAEIARELEARGAPMHLSSELQGAVATLAHHELELCVARKQGGRSKTWLAHHHRCLTHRKAELEGILAAASQVPDDRLGALEVAGVHHAIDGCSEVRVAQGSEDSAPVDDPIQLEARARLAQANALVRADPVAATALADTKLDAVTKESHPELFATRQRLLGILASHRGDLEAAVHHLELAAATALGSDQHRLAAQAWTELGGIERARGNEGAAQTWESYAQAVLDR